MVVRAEKEHSGLQGYRLLLAVLGTLDFQLTRLKKKKKTMFLTRHEENISNMTISHPLFSL